MDRQKPSKNPETERNPENIMPSIDMSGADERNLLVEQNAQLDFEVKSTLAEKIQRITSKELPKSSDYIGFALITEIEESIRLSGYNPAFTSIGPPTQKNELTESIDLAFNVAGVAKSAGRNPVELAKELSPTIENNNLIANTSNTGPFMNIELDYSVFAPRVIDEVAQYGSSFGHYRDGEPQVIVIDYSSPNVAKNMTVAHLRSTIIGHSLTKIHEASGNIPFGVNHIGDWGTQFGNIIYEYQKEQSERGDEFLEELDADPTGTLMRLYRAFNERREADEDAVITAQAIFLKLEQGDPELIKLWDQFKQWSLRDFGPSYERLSIEFDAIQGESFYEDKMKPTIELALERGVLKTNPDGAIVFPAQPLSNPTSGVINERVMLDPEGKPRDEIIVKPSGGTVYLTRDLAAIQYRGEELGADKVLYVIGKEQQTHCLELFAMADQLEFMPIGNAEHISFGHLNIDGQKMKSRAGKIALLNDILDESVEAAADMLEARNIERGVDRPLTVQELEIARMVGVGAVIFNDLKQNREKDIEFNPDTAKGLEAGSAAYIQYTNSRLGSIIEKVGQPDEIIEVPADLAITERRILTETSRFPQVVKEAALSNSPHKLASYLTEYCQTINMFYHDRPIAKAETDNERNFRLNLVKTAHQVVKNASYLLHLELPERM